jgi:myo-inositol-1(or 4)-monophosphatase
MTTASSSSTVVSASELETLRAMLDTVKPWVLEAGAYAQERLQQGVSVQTKTCDTDLVTEVDLTVDRMLSTRLANAFSSHALISEEASGTPEVLPKGPCWVLDPIDGTTNAVHRLPHYAISLAYCLDGKPLLGLLYQPAFHQCFEATLSQGAFCNGRPLQVSRVQHWQKALYSTGFSSDRGSGIERNLPYFRHFAEKTHGVRRLGSAALDMAYVASGYLDVMWQRSLKCWDVAAGMLLVQEAGGLVEALEAPTALMLSLGGVDLLASNGNPHLTSSVRELLSLTPEELAARS